MNLQLQPERVPSMDMSRARAIIEAVATDRGLVAGFEFSEGSDNGPYLNFTFLAKDAARLWSKVRADVLENPEVGAAIARASIIICEGPDGWDNYRLLHHFDQSLKLESPE